MGAREGAADADEGEICEGSAMSGGGFDQDVRGIHFSQGEVIAADLDLERVAERRGAHEGDGGAGDEAHFAKTQKGGALFGELDDSGAGAHGEVGEPDGGGGHGKSGARGADKLDDDLLRRALAEGDAGVADLAEESALP